MRQWWNELRSESPEDIRYLREEMAEMAKKASLSKKPITVVFLVITVCCSIMIFLTLLNLPEPTSQRSSTASSSSEKQDSPQIGEFGKMTIEILPEDLAFTIFLPSEEAFGRDLKLKVNESLEAGQLNDTQAVLSRILGFSTVPRSVYLADLPASGEEVDFDSLSGFRLDMWKDEDGRRLVVNRVKSKVVDLKVGEVVIHIMDGVIMDFDFAQSFQDVEEDDD